MKYLITGGAGFIGSHLCEELLERGEEVFVVDDLSTGSLDNIAHLERKDQFHCVIGSILDKDLLKSLVEDCDVVFHLAAAVGVRYVMENPLASLKINVRGTENVLECANPGKKKVIIASSSEIYGKNGKIPYREDADRTLGPVQINRWSYSCSKAVDEFMALAYHREKGLPTIILRLFNVCGPRQTDQYGMVIPRFIRQALLNRPITVYGDGKQTRCFAYVKDVVVGMADLAKEENAVGEIYNLGSNEEIEIKWLAKRIKEVTKSRSPVKYISYEKAYADGFEDMQRRVPDITKITNLIGYKNQNGIEDTLLKTIEYFRK